MSSSIKPLGNRVLVKIVKKSTTSSAGIIISIEEKDENAKGIVVAIGQAVGKDDDADRQLMSQIAIDQTVIFSSYSGQEFKDPKDADTTYKLLKISDIAGFSE